MGKSRDDRNKARVELARATLNVNVLTAGIADVLGRSRIETDPYQIEDLIDFSSSSLELALQAYYTANTAYYAMPPESNDE